MVKDKQLIRLFVFVLYVSISTANRSWTWLVD